MRVRRFDDVEFSNALGREPEKPDDKYPDKWRPLPKDLLSEHSQAAYLFTYLSKLGAKTIVVEETYVDGSFLADYTYFYATVFAHFDRFCKRVHFFNHSFDDAEFIRHVLRVETEADAGAFASTYLGFVVVRPLPQAIIGRTALKTLPRVDGESDPHYCVVVDTGATLCGLKLTVEASLPFQQQDSAVAACATVALWSAFFRTAEMFGTATPRPATITQAATAGTVQERALPSHGLTVEQICEAIRANGLDPEVLNLDQKQAPLLTWLRGYLELGIPAILALKFANGAHDGEHHAVTAVGYRLGDVLTVKELGPDYYEPPSVASRITHLICHDDNVGPFADFGVCCDDDGGNVRLTSKDHGTEQQPALLDIESVVLPVYQKMRLGFPAVQAFVMLLDRALALIMKTEPEVSREWDITLTTTNQFKQNLGADVVDPDQRLQILTRAQPRFMWQVVLRTQSGEAFRILADATAFHRSIPLRQAIIRDRGLVEKTIEILGDVLDDDDNAAPLRSFFIEELKGLPGVGAA